MKKLPFIMKVYVYSYLLFVVYVIIVAINELLIKKY